MSFTSPKREGISQKSQSYPGTPRSQLQVCVNLSEVFQGFDNDLTITPNDQSTAYQTALEQAEELPPQTNNGINSLQEMEHIRHQLQSVLNPLGKDTSPGDPLNSSSTSSVDTIALLRNALPYSSPELQLDENGVLMTSLNSNVSRSLYRPMTSPTLLDSSLVAENTILKDNIEKERCRRKHCEQQIHELQDKLLESQEQLAVVESTERKKGIMIEQLDQTLASVVDGWKKQESNRIESYNQLKQQKEDLEASKHRQEELLNKFEIELKEAVGAVIYEQEKFKNFEIAHQKMCQQHAEEVEALKNEMKNLQDENLTLEEQKHDLLEQKQKEVEDKDKMLADLKKSLEQERLQMKRFSEKSNDTEQQLAGIVQGLEEKLKATSSTISKCSDLSRSLKEKEEKMLTMHREFENVTKEKETLSMEVSLLNSKYDALKTKQDSGMRLKLESEFNEQILEIQKQITMTENELRTSQKKQITDLSKRHKEELEKQKKIFQQGLIKKDEMLTKLRADYERDLEDAKNEISSLSLAGQSLESQRSELMNRMKYMMQQHWEETVTLLNGDVKSLGHSGYSNNLQEQFSSTFRSEFQHQQQQHQKYQQHQKHQQYQPPVTQMNNNSSHLYGNRRQQPLLFNENINNNNLGINRDVFGNETSSVTQPLLPGYLPRLPHHPSRDKVAPYGHYSTVDGSVQDALITKGPRNEYHSSKDKVVPYDQFSSVDGSIRNEYHLSSDKVAPYDQYDTVAQDALFNDESGGQQQSRSFTHPSLNRTSSPVLKSNNSIEHLKWSQGTHRSEETDRRQNNNNSAPTHDQSSKKMTDGLSNPLHAPFPPTSRSKQQQYNHPPERLECHTADKTRLGFDGAAEYRDYRQTAATKNCCEDPVSLLYQDINDDELDVIDAQDATADDTQKQQQLGHFIEKLLERSPGQPLDEIPVKDVTQEQLPDSIKHEVDQLLRHTPKKQPIKTNNPAFKMSVVKKPPNIDKKDSVEEELKNFTEEKLIFMLKQLMDKEKNADGVSEEKPSSSNHEYEESSGPKDYSHNNSMSRKRHTKKTAETKPALQKKTVKASSSRNVAAKSDQKREQLRGRNGSTWK